MDIQCVEAQGLDISFIASADAAAISHLEEIILKATGEVHFVQLGKDDEGRSMQRFFIRAPQHEKLLCNLSSGDVNNHDHMTLLIQKILKDAALDNAGKEAGQ